MTEGLCEHRKRQGIDVQPCHRIDATETQTQRQSLAQMSSRPIVQTRLADEPVTEIIGRTSANCASIAGIKISTKTRRLAARPAGTEDIYKICAERFRDETHLRHLLAEAQRIVDAAIEPKESL